MSYIFMHCMCFFVRRSLSVEELGMCQSDIESSPVKLVTNASEGR